MDSSKIQRLVSAPALSVLVAILFIIALAGESSITPIASIDDVKLQLFDSSDGAEPFDDRARLGSMFKLLGSMHALGASYRFLAEVPAAALSIATTVVSLAATHSQALTLLAIITAQLSCSLAFADWAAIVDADAHCGIGSILVTIAAGLSIIAALAHSYESYVVPHARLTRADTMLNDSATCAA